MFFADVQRRWLGTDVIITRKQTFRQEYKCNMAKSIQAAAILVAEACKRGYL